MTAHLNNPPRLSKYKNVIHIIQLVIIMIIMGLTGVKIFTRDKSRPMTRSGMMALGFGVKAQIAIGYQMVSENMERFKKWASFKANLILNCLEIVTWPAVVYLGVQANRKSCTGTNCYISWAVIGVAIFISIYAQLPAYISFLEFRQMKRERIAGAAAPELAYISPPQYDVSPVNSSSSNSRLYNGNRERIDVSHTKPYAPAEVV